jgi:simple sugar transport system ATP-binding protein
MKAIGGYQLFKRFGHIQALDGASVDVRAGEVVAVLGDNGAGKSTLIHTLAGLTRPDAGYVQIADQRVVLTNARDALSRGVECVHQDLALWPHLPVVDNLFLGSEPVASGLRGRLGVLARREMHERADAALKDLAIELPSLAVAVSELSGGQRQAIAIARAVMRAETALLMDEPTAALGTRQSEVVGELIRAVAAKGLGVLVVSHDIPRMLRVADRIVILYRGKTVHDRPAGDLTVLEVVATMVGQAPGAG